jgi:aquaporin Z
MNGYISRTCLWKNPGGLKFWVKYYYPGRAPAPDRRELRQLPPGGEIRGMPSPVGVRVASHVTRRLLEEKKLRNYRAYLAELIGTFFLVFSVAATGLVQNQFAPLAVGATIMVMVYAGGHISGGHYNPAVTMAVLVRRRITLLDAVAYWVVQVVAGLLAAGLAYWIMNPASVTALSPSGRGLAAAIVAEVLYTFALAFVVLNVATSKAHPNNSFYGLAIGFTVAAGAFTIGGISGGVFNPAVALGAAEIGLIHGGAPWLYLVFQLAAGAAAGFAFLALSPGELTAPPPATDETQASTPAPFA